MRPRLAQRCRARRRRDRRHCGQPALIASIGNSTASSSDNRAFNTWISTMTKRFRLAAAPLYWPSQLDIELAGRSCKVLAGHVQKRGSKGAGAGSAAISHRLRPLFHRHTRLSNGNSGSATVRTKGPRFRQSRIEWKSPSCCRCRALPKRRRCRS